MSRSSRLLNLDPFKIAFEEQSRKTPPPDSEPPAKSAPPSELEAPIKSVAPAELPSPVNLAAPAKQSPQPLPITAAPKSVPPIKSAAPGNLIVAPETPHTRVANEIFDRIMPTLKPRTQVVLWRLLRLSVGFNNSTCHVSIGKLEEMTGVAATQVRDSLKDLERRGLIKRIEVDYANKNQDERGITFEIRLPRLAPSRIAGGAKTEGGSKSAAPSKLEPNKGNAFKGKDIKADSPKVTRLTPEEKTETLQMIVDLITKNGYSFEQAENQFGGNLNPEDWALIRTKVEEKGTIS